MYHPNKPYSLFDVFQGREVTFTLPRAAETRLRFLAARIADDDPAMKADQERETWEETVEILVGSCFERGLYESEKDDGLFFDCSSGRFVSHKSKCSLRFRLKLALRELRGRS